MAGEKEKLRLGSAWQGPVWRGKVTLGKARTLFELVAVPQIVMVRCGGAWPGTFWSGMARLGSAGQGKGG
jgi:hypothetical protein